MLDPLSLRVFYDALEANYSAAAVLGDENMSLPSGLRLRSPSLGGRLLSRTHRRHHCRPASHLPVAKRGRWLTRRPHVPVSHIHRASD